MKIEQLIVQHLYNNKKVTLQGIGTFKLNPSVILPADPEKDKDFVMPENAFEFEYNLKAKEDDALIQYIVQHTRKILPLASADLDSYVMLAKQFLNIGKPLVIDGVGTIQKNQSGNYQFIPGHYIIPRIDDIPKQLREKRDESVSFESEAPANNKRRNLMIFVTLLVIAATGLGIYYMVTHSSTSSAVNVPVANEPAMVADSLATDTLALSVKDSTAGQQVAVPADTNNFKIVLKIYPSSGTVRKAFEKLSAYGHKLEIIEVDSFEYQLAMPFNAPLSDTTRVRDSLQQFFGGNPFVKH